MLGNFVTRILVLALGYAYPAFECFKTIEKNRVEVQELHFWCQYWIIAALVTVFERFGDIFMSWLPMYGEMKLALFIYLWYPKTKTYQYGWIIPFIPLSVPIFLGLGLLLFPPTTIRLRDPRDDYQSVMKQGTGYVYGSILKPYMAKHEPDIDRNIHEIKARAWDLLVFYGLNCTQVGRTIVFQTLEYLTSQAGLLRQPNLQKVKEKEILPASPSPPPSGILKIHKQPSDKRRPPIPPTSPAYNHRSATHPMKLDTVQIHLREQAKFVSNEDASTMDKEYESSPKVNLVSAHDALHEARLKLRRTRSVH